MRRLTRQAQVLIFAILIIAVVVIAFILFKPNDEPTVKPDEDVDYQITLVAENKKIISTYIDAISADKSSTEYKKCDIHLTEGMAVGEYTLGKDQTFSKYIQLIGPEGEELLTKLSKQQVTHYAYTMLLTGDIVEYTNPETQEKTYAVDNARITYQRIPLVLLSNENSVYLANKKKTQEKMVNLQEFIDALKDIEKRQDMIDW